MTNPPVPVMGKAVREWLAPGLLATLATRLLATESGGEPGIRLRIRQNSLVVRGFDVPIKVLCSRIPRALARSGGPTARLGQRVVGIAVRGSALFRERVVGSPARAKVFAQRRGLPR